MHRPPLVSRSFALLLCAQSCFGYSMSSFFLAPKFMVSELNATPAQVGAMTACYGVATVVCLLGAGSWSDRHGRLPLLRAGAALMAASALAFAAVEHVGPLLFGLRFAQGAAFALAFAGGAALTVDLAPPERLGQAIGLFGVSMLAMNAIAPVATELVAARYGWSAAFALAAIGALLCLVLTRNLPRNEPHRSFAVEISMFRMLRQRRQLRIAVVICSAGAVFGAAFTFAQPFALSLGMTEVRGFFVAYALAGVTCRVGIGDFPDRFGRHRVAVLALFGYALVTAGMVWLRPGWLAPAGAGFGLAHGLFYPSFNALAVEGADPELRGKLMALFQGWFNVGFAGGGLAFGYVAQRFDYPTVFALAAVLALAATAELARSREAIEPLVSPQPTRDR